MLPLAGDYPVTGPIPKSHKKENKKEKNETRILRDDSLTSVIKRGDPKRRKWWVRKERKNCTSNGAEGRGHTSDAVSGRESASVVRRPFLQSPILVRRTVFILQEARLRLLSSFIPSLLCRRLESV